MRVYYDRDADVNLIKSKKVAVIGYGSQGHAHALNLKDSGVKEVRVALRPTSASVAKATGAGLEVMTPADAARWADVVMVVTPDELQARLYAEDLAPNLRQGVAIAFAHVLENAGDAVRRYGDRPWNGQHPCLCQGPRHRIERAFGGRHRRCSRQEAGSCRRR